MEELFIEPASEASWYENVRLIQEFLESYKKSLTPKEDFQKEELSWLKMVKKTQKNIIFLS